MAGSGEGIKKILNRVFVVLAGYTPLHHCLTCNGSIATLEMAKMLIQKGAEVNTVNRDGILPFYIAIVDHYYYPVLILDLFPDLPATLTLGFKPSNSDFKKNSGCESKE